MTEQLLYVLMGDSIIEMTNAKSLYEQEKVALSIEKIVHEVVMQYEQLLQPWESMNLYDSIQIFDYDADIFGHKLHFELTPDYVTTYSNNTLEHYQQLLEQSSLDETEKQLVLDDYAKKTKHNQNKTLPPHFHLIEFYKNKLKDTRDRLEDTIYNRPPEDYKAYYESLRQTYGQKVREEILSLQRWRCKQCHSLTTSDYMEKIEGVKSALSELAPEMPLEYMLLNGSDDTANFGQYLICERKSWDKEKLIKIIQLTAAWQWLLKEQEALQITQQKNDSSGNSNNNVTLESALEDLLQNHLHMKDYANKVTFEGKTFRRDNVIIGLMHYLLDKGVIKEKNHLKFISLIAPIMKLTDKQVENLRRTCSNDEKELSSYSCKLKDLERHHIKKQNTCVDEKEIDKLFYKWDGLYKAIDKAAQKSEPFKNLIATK